MKPVAATIQRLAMSSIKSDIQPYHRLQKRLLLPSIHDVAPRFEQQIDALAEFLEDRIGSLTFSMLVVPDHWGSSPITPGSAFATKVRKWSDAGVDIFLHGWLHKDEVTHRGVDGWKARHMTAREGEFLGLSYERSLQRIVDGRALLEDICGRPLAGFVAPAWLYGRGALKALETAKIQMAEDHLKVWDPTTGRALARGPVITWASRSPARTNSSLALARAARILLRNLEVLRIALHPGDVGNPAIMQSADKTLRLMGRDREFDRYSSLRPKAA